MGKTKDLSAFERGMVVGARCVGLSVSRTPTLLGISRSAVSCVYQRWSTTQRTSNQRQASGQNWLIDGRGQRRLTRIVQSNRQATVSQLTVQYSIGAKRPIKECTTRRTLTRMGYGSRRLNRVPVLSTKHKKLWLQWAKERKQWTLEDWKNIAWSDESWFLLFHADGRTRVCRKPHEYMHPSCHVSKLQADGGGVMVWGVFSWQTLGPLIKVEQRLNATGYLNIITNQPIPQSMTAMGERAWPLQPDHAPYRTKYEPLSRKETHTCCKINKNLVASARNPIENLWFELKRAVHKRRLKDIKDLERFCMEERSKIPSNVFSNLIKNYRKRLSAIILARGGCTKY
ncbi:TCB1 transposase, partial [Polyodon spathula]|nr:TCB1 transposase [Polyodon spathula]